MVEALEFLLAKFPSNDVLEDLMPDCGPGRRRYGIMEDYHNNPTDAELMKLRALLSEAAAYRKEKP